MGSNSSARTDAVAAAFDVPGSTRMLGALVDRSRPLWVALGNLESRILADELQGIDIVEPIYVTGLARSGTTIVLELIAALPGVVSHRYADYPLLFTPMWWEQIRRRAARRGGPAVERTHGDGMMVTPESPEAIEEVLWMTFFPDVHDPAKSNVLDGGTHAPEFATFYRDHIRKLLLCRGGRRYAAKGNYNLTRLEYLLRLFEDARFVVPVRDPVSHIASLMRQHARFCEGERANAGALAHMRRIGHFEFGLDRRPINTGDAAAVAEIDRLWSSGREAAGWAIYWSMLYGYIHQRLEQNPALARATKLVRFEDLCDSPEATIRSLLDHCGLHGDDAFVAAFARRLRRPAYYRPDLTAQECADIRALSKETAALFGYG